MKTDVRVLLRAEGLRLWRHLSEWMVLLILAAVLVFASVWAGLAAADHRASLADSLSAWQESMTARQENAVRDPGAMGAAEEYASELARRHAPPAQLTPGGGMVLSLRQLDVLTPEIRVSTQTRYSDGRFSDQVFNPLLQELGLLDLATLVALLLPLAVIAMGYGMVQEARERGIWRQVCAQTDAPWQTLGVAFLLRWLAVAVTVSLATLPAFLLDPGATAGAALMWLLVVAVYSAFWIALLMVLCLTPLSSGGSATAALGLWVLLTFILPVVMAWTADQRTPMPSRLMAVIELRDAQETIGEQTDSLTAQWYENHPQYAGVSALNHSRFVNNVQRDLHIDATVRYVMLAFEQARAAQFDDVRRRAWVAPGLGVLAAADVLAGIDASRYLDFVQAVNTFEDEWRAYFVPRIMSYRGLSAEEHGALPRFAGIPPASVLPAAGMLGQMLLPVLLLLLVFWRLRRRLARP